MREEFVQYSAKNNKITNILLVIAITGLLSGLVAFAYMGTFMRIVGDDYFYAAVLKQNGFWRGQTHAYMNHMLFHGDRYTLNFFSLFFSLFPPKVNAIIPALVICIFTAVLYFFCTALFSRMNFSTNKLLRLAISLVVSFFTFWLAPTVNQGLYWRSSMLPSFGPIIGTLFLAAFILWPQRVKRTTALFTFIFALINAGLSENGAAYQATMSGILFIAWFWAKAKKGKHANRLLVLSIITFIASIGGVLIMWFSPGIANYHGDMSTNLSSTMILSIRYTYNHYKEMLLSRFVPFILLFLVGISIFIMSKRANNDHLPAKKNAIRFWLLSLVVIQVTTFLFILSLTIPSAFIRNVYPDPRHFIGSIMVIIIAMVASGYIFGAIVVSLLQRTGKGLSKTIILTAGIIFALVNLVYPIWTIPQITAEKLKFQYWAALWDERNQEILAAAANGEKQIHVVQMDHIIEGVAELGPDPSNPWYNLPASQYYGIEIIADLPGWDEGLAQFKQRNR
jgi:hypothetical protein